MKRHAITVVSGLVGLLLTTAACQSASFKKNEDGSYSVKIKGDDDQMVKAKGLEKALEQAQQNLANAQEGGNAAYIKDWSQIVNNIIKAKNHDGNSATSSSMSSSVN